MMENPSVEKIAEFLEKIKKGVIEQKGFILLPTFDGIRVFEISKDRLEQYLRLEGMYKKLKEEEDALPKLDSIPTNH